MNNLSYSFKPDGSWFIFCVDTGKTVETNSPLNNARRARREWVRLRGV